MYRNIFWKCWNWPVNSRERLLYWFPWYLVIETSRFTVRIPNYKTRSYGLWMWRHRAIRLRRCLSRLTDYNNSATIGPRIQHTVITCHSSQHTMNGLLSTKSCMC
jgi:hypothetical protein